MDTGLYVALSGQLALDRRMATIANNVANAGTVGYRAEGVSFGEMVSRTSTFTTSFATPGKAHFATASGGLTKTGNAFDVAVQGHGFLALAAPQGTIYSRDGRMQMLADGQLVSLNGYAVLDAGGAPLQLDPTGGAPQIARDGMIHQGGKRMGAIGLFALPETGAYHRTDNAGIVPSQPPEAIVSFANDGFAQGFVEEANVNPIHEMVRLIEVTRAFEGLQSLTDDVGNAERNAIQTLGGK
jgi:flagellar basal-body rod protein FlgF